MMNYKNRRDALARENKEIREANAALSRKLAVEECTTYGLRNRLELEQATVAALERQVSAIVGEKQDSAKLFARELGEAHSRLTDLVDDAWGPHPTMPIGQLIDIVKEKVDESFREKRALRKRNRHLRKRLIIRRRSSKRLILPDRDAFTVTTRCLKLLRKLPWVERSRVISALTAVRDTTLPQVPSRPFAPPPTPPPSQQEKASEAPPAPKPLDNLQAILAMDLSKGPRDRGLSYQEIGLPLTRQDMDELESEAKLEDDAKAKAPAPKFVVSTTRTRGTDSWIVCRCGRSISVPIATPLRENRQSCTSTSCSPRALPPCKCGLVWKYCGDRNWQAKSSEPQAKLEDSKAPPVDEEALRNADGPEKAPDGGDMSAHPYRAALREIASSFGAAISVSAWQAMTPNTARVVVDQLTAHLRALTRPETKSGAVEASGPTLDHAERRAERAETAERAMLPIVEAMVHWLETLEHHGKAGDVLPENVRRPVEDFRDARDRRNAIKLNDQTTTGCIPVRTWKTDDGEASESKPESEAEETWTCSVCGQTSSNVDGWVLGDGYTLCTKPSCETAWKANVDTGLPIGGHVLHTVDGWVAMAAMDKAPADTGLPIAVGDVWRHVDYGEQTCLEPAVNGWRMTCHGVFEADREHPMYMHDAFRDRDWTFVRRAVKREPIDLGFMRMVPKDHISDELWQIWRQRFGKPGGSVGLANSHKLIRAWASDGSVWVSVLPAPGEPTIKTVKLEPRGAHYVGICPFHDEKTSTPTLFVNLTTKRYYCFGCNARGKVEVGETKLKSDAGGGAEAERRCRNCSSMDPHGDHCGRVLLRRRDDQSCSDWTPKEGKKTP